MHKTLRLLTHDKNIPKMHCLWRFATAYPIFSFLCQSKLLKISTDSTAAIRTWIARLHAEAAWSLSGRQSEIYYLHLYLLYAPQRRGSALYVPMLRQHFLRAAIRGGTLLNIIYIISPVCVVSSLFISPYVTNVAAGTERRCVGPPYADRWYIKVSLKSTFLGVLVGKQM